jgi:chromosome segregation ATPase
MDNSLIAGMPEVIAYIKKIEEENKQLKEQVKEFQECVSEHVGDDAEPLDIHNVIQELKDEIDELNEKYENEVDTNKMLMEAIEANSSEKEKQVEKLGNRILELEYELEIKNEVKQERSPAAFRN